MPKRAPCIRSYKNGREARGSLAWEEYLLVHEKYLLMCSQTPGTFRRISPERLAALGGFAYEAAVNFLGRAPTTWRRESNSDVAPLGFILESFDGLPTREAREDMSRMLELDCPSGLRVKLRSIKGKDLDGLRDKRRLATGEAITDLLNECTVEVIDRSIYAGAAKFDWADALIGDRVAAFIGLRSATSGDEYQFRVRCQDSGCRQMIDWALNLSDLEQKQLPDDSKEKFLAGNRFEAQMNGTPLVFKLVVGRDQVRLSKIVSQQQAQRKPGDRRAQRVMLGLANRIVSVEGVSNVVEWLEDQDLRDLLALVRQMDAHDCGVDTTITIECAGENGCGLTQEIELPLDVAFFGMEI